MRGQFIRLPPFGTRDPTGWRCTIFFQCPDYKHFTRFICSLYQIITLLHLDIIPSQPQEKMLLSLQTLKGWLHDTKNLAPRIYPNVFSLFFCLEN